jgi:hypothetical protein
MVTATEGLGTTMDLDVELSRGGYDEDINPDKGRTTLTKPAQAPQEPLTRARACEFNFMVILKNEGP